MSWEFSTNKPIFLQITDILIEDIVSAKRFSGDRMPPVRELALQAGVNPNTVQRAYTELERQGLIETRRGDGSYITTDTELLKLLSKESLSQTVEIFLLKVRAMGFDDTTVLNALTSKLNTQIGGKNGTTTKL